MIAQPNEILIVDDEVGIRDLLSEILRDEGYQVSVAENAGQARTYRARAQPSLPFRRGRGGNKIALMGWAEDMNDHSASRGSPCGAHPGQARGCLADADRRLGRRARPADHPNRLRGRGSCGPHRQMHGSFKLGACCACRKLNPDVLVVQSTQDRTAKNVSSTLNGARCRRILVQR